MAVGEILLLGNPILREKCSPVKHISAEETQTIIGHLRDTLEDFRKRKGFGRGIAAPQIGVTKQIIYINFEYTGALINPKIIKRSKKKFRLWDDCFSFPDILAHVERNYSIVVAFLDEQGKRKQLAAEGALSELLQHEIDHLNGILAIDRALDSKHIILRSEYEKLAHKLTGAL
ncbi:MAG: peptide deformylase [Ignavibacteriales bacterium]|nr:peptide deformylase [Ignavibacteriales bacterium]